MPSDNKKSDLKTMSPEMRERQKIMSRMTPEEKIMHKWRCHYEKATPQLLEVIEYCQKDNRIVPHAWRQIIGKYMKFTHRNKFTEYPPLKSSLILGASHAPDIEKRQRFLTQIYWCYKNMFMSSMFKDIMETSTEDWVVGYYQEDKISLELIKREYARWLNVNYYPEHNIYNYCTNHHKKHKKIETAEKLHDNQEGVLDDESTTFIGSR